MVVPLRPVPPTNTSSAGFTPGPPPEFRHPPRTPPSPSRQGPSRGSDRGCGARAERRRRRLARAGPRSPRRRARGKRPCGHQARPASAPSGRARGSSGGDRTASSSFEGRCRRSDKAAQGAPAREQELIEADAQKALRGDLPCAGVDGADPLLPPVKALAAAARVKQAAGLGYPRGRGVAAIPYDVDELRLGKE